MARRIATINASEPSPALARGEAELVVDGEHFRRIVVEGICQAKVSVDIATADFKAMLVPTGGRRAESIVAVLRRLAVGGVEVRLLVTAGEPLIAVVQAQERPHEHEGRDGGRLAERPQMALMSAPL